MNNVIVYRNPLESAFWESGVAFPLVVSTVLAIIVFAGVSAIIRQNMRYGGFLWRHGLKISLFSTVLTFIVMMMVTL